MAISGVADSDILTIANKLAISRKQLASALAYTYQALTATATDATGHVMSLAWTNFQGIVYIDWGDGSALTRVSSASSPQTHTYASAGAKTATINGPGQSKTASVTL